MDLKTNIDVDSTLNKHLDNVHTTRYIKPMRFTWDDDKNTANQKKHGISFEEASKVFDGTEEIEFDSEHSTEEEDRYLAFGRIDKHGAVIVVFCELIDDEIRIISARRE